MSNWINKIEKHERDTLSQILGALLLPDLHDHQSKQGALNVILLKIQVIRGQALSAKLLLEEIK